jgi:hypothetical protein
MTAGELCLPSFANDGRINTSRRMRQARDSFGEFIVNPNISVMQRTKPMGRPILAASVPPDVADSGKIRLGGTARLPSRSA